MVVSAMINGALMPKLPYITPWHIFGSALVVIGTALMCTFIPVHFNDTQVILIRINFRHHRHQHQQRQDLRLQYHNRRRIWMLCGCWFRRCAITCGTEGYS
jgi:hypothetical protein